jgi:hypothetical protein
MSERSLAERLAVMPEARRKKILASLSPRERSALEYTWEFWARPKQLEPPGDWRVWMLCAGRGFGKALAVDTPIPMPSGWKTMGELQVGDEVFDEHGRPCRVTFATEVMHEHECFDIVLSDGTIITADADHQWLTWTHAARKAARRRGRPSASRGSSRRSSQPKRSPVRSTTESMGSAGE